MVLPMSLRKKLTKYIVFFILFSFMLWFCMAWLSEDDTVIGGDRPKV